MNGRVNKTFGQLYSATMAREAKPKDLGYNIVVMWEIDWRLFVFRIKRIQRRVKMWLLPPNAHNVATLSALPTKVGFGAAHQNLGATAWLPNQGCRRAALCAALGYLSGRQVLVIMPESTGHSEAARLRRVPLNTYFLTDGMPPGEALRRLSLSGCVGCCEMRSRLGSQSCHDSHCCHNGAHCAP